MRQAVSWRMASAIDANRSWIAQAIAKLDEDRRREVDTPLLALGLPELPACRIYIKDETAHPTGSLKHRLARSLFLHAICNGDIQEHTTVVEASSGSTAISEAYFANLLGLPFIAVVPIGTATAKREAIARAGAQIHLVEPHDEISVVAARVARDMNGHFMDQFTLPSGQRIGAATITSLKVYSRNWLSRLFRFPGGSWLEPAPAARARQ